jgi:hypothetical protein
MIDYLAIFAGFGTAFITVLLGYFKTTKPEDFSAKKLLSTVLLGAAVGIVVAVLQVPVDNAMAYLGEAGATVWIYWFSQGIYKWYKDKYPTKVVV